MKSENKQGQSKGLKIGLIVLAAVVVAAGGYFFVTTQKYNQMVKDVVAAGGIYPGITIYGEDVSGMETEAAIDYLTQHCFEELGQDSVTLTYEEEEWKLPFLDLGAHFDIEEAVTTAYAMGREGTEKENKDVIVKLLKSGTEIPLNFGYEEEAIEEQLALVAEAFDQEVENSALTRTSGKFIITEEKPGLAMQVEETKADIMEVMDLLASGTVEITAEVVEPSITHEDNEEVTDLLGSFSTKYSAGDANRNTNLVVGCDYINGTVVAPGEIFSVADALGPQTYARGYRAAGVYVNGKVEAGLGGGVCQISTTCYNAAIFAELEIVERQPHSMTVGYVPLGRDAAIAEGYKDLRVRNNTDAPIYIECYAASGTLQFNIFGKETRSAGRTLSFETVYEGTVQKPDEKVTEDPEKPEGEREITHNGRTGSKVSVYKIVMQNGKQISKDWFSSSSYRAVADEVTVGTKPLEDEVTEVTAPVDSSGVLGVPDAPDAPDAPDETYNGLPVIENDTDWEF